MQSSSNQARDPVRAFLESATEAKLEARRRSRRVAQLESQCTRTTQRMSGMPSGGSGGAEAMWIALAEERAQEYEAIQKELARHHEVEAFIGRLECLEQKAVLRLRYLEGFNWVKVQQQLYRDGIFYSERQIYRIHGQALQAARELWDAEQRGGADG